jgi:L-histidine Nalpha-methyltransferase
VKAPTPRSAALAEAVGRIEWVEADRSAGADAGPVRDSVATMADEVRAGLSSDAPWLPSKYFYDARGAALFDAITELPEYDLLRNEDAILAAHAPALAGRVRPREILELGSGSGRKTERVVDAALAVGRLETLSFFDVNRDGLADALGRFGVAHPRLALRALVGDFTRDLGRVPRRDDALVLLLGSTIGNLDPRTEAPVLFRDVARVLGGAGAFLCGFDLVKDARELELAYDDPRGVTAEFNRNILRVINARLGADFDPDAFDHVARYDAERGWIEMRLRARRAMHVAVPRAGYEFRCAAGDEIRTEISAKWTRPSVERALAGTGLAIAQWWTDARGRFADALIVPD